MNKERKMEPIEQVCLCGDCFYCNAYKKYQDTQDIKKEDHEKEIE